MDSRETKLLDDPGIRLGVGSVEHGTDPAASSKPTWRTLQRSSGPIPGFSALAVREVRNTGGVAVLLPFREVESARDVSDEVDRPNRPHAEFARALRRRDRQSAPMV